MCAGSPNKTEDNFLAVNRYTFFKVIVEHDYNNLVQRVQV